MSPLETAVQYTKIFLFLFAGMIGYAKINVIIHLLQNKCL